MPGAEDNALIASSEFDPTAFAQGMGVMITSLDQAIAKEDELNQKLAQQQKILAGTNAALNQTTQQVAQLDKTSAGYSDNLQKLTQQQQQLTQQQAQQAAALKDTQAQAAAAATSADKYKAALSGITQVAQQVKAQGGPGLFNTATLNAQIQQVNQLAGSFRNIFQGKVDTTELDKLEAQLAGTTDEFEKLRDIIGFVQQKLDTLDPKTQEFQDLTKVVSVGNDVLAQFDKISGDVGDRTETVRRRLANLRAELAQMAIDGKEGTDEFREMQKEAGELQDALDKTGERVHTFSNDLRGLEAGVEAIRGIAAGFELAEGASALFGVKSESVEESIKRLNAIMAIANGLQEVNNLLKKESVLRLVTEEVATKAYTITQRVLAATLGTTAAASRGLATALAATGVGALIVGIGILITVMSSWTSKTKEQAEAQERLNKANELGLEINQDYLNQLDAGLRVEESLIGKQQALRQKARQSDVERAQEAARNAEELRVQQAENLKQQVEQNQNEIEQQREGFEQAEAQLAAIRKQNADAAEELANAPNRISQAIARSHFADTELMESLEKTVDQFGQLQRKAFQLSDAQQVQENKFEQDRANERLAIRKAELAALDDFQKRVVDLQKRLTDARNKQARQDAATLSKTAQDNLNSELNALQRDVRLKTLTQQRADQLKALTRQVAGVELTTTLRDFEKKAAEAQQSIEDSLLQLRLQSQQTRAEALRDSLEREAAIITAEYRKEFVGLEDARRQALQGVKDTFDQGLISEGQFQRNSDRIKALYEQLFNDLELTTSRKREKLGRLAFQQGSDLLRQLFADSGATLTEKTNQQILQLTARYTGGVIRYEQYQRQLTKILQDESKKRIDQEITENTELLAGTQRRLAAELDPQQRKALQDQIIQLREQIAQLQRQKADAEAQTRQTNDANFKADVQRVADYATVIGSIIEKVIGFWQAANEAEQKALDKSISLQEKRVDAATRIAERGNAEYLRLEEDRLNDLQVKQENAARRQLAINAVLQASQALVAFTSALAQGISTGGPLGGLAIAAAVLGVIASGYSIVKSLQEAQNQSVQLYTGTKSVARRNGEPAGRDTVPAMLTEGEAVLPVDTARAYRPAVDAIFDHAIDPAALNRFVLDTQVGRRPTVTLAAERLGEATEVQLAHETGLAQATAEQGRKLDETNARLGELADIMGSLGVSLVLDKKGLALSLLEATRRQKLQKKV